MGKLTNLSIIGPIPCPVLKGTIHSHNCIGNIYCRDECAKYIYLSKNTRNGQIDVTIHCKPLNKLTSKLKIWT